MALVEFNFGFRFCHSNARIFSVVHWVVDWKRATRDDDIYISWTAPTGKSRRCRAPTNFGILTVMIIKAMHAVLRRLGRLAGLACAGWLVACAPTPQPLLVDEGEPVHTIFVLSNGWHTSIVLSRDALPSGPIPESADFPEATFLEFGWGDREYYPSSRPTMGMALAAALMPTPAVMHLAGLLRPPQEHYSRAEVLAMRLSKEALARLIARIDTSFDRPEGGRGETIARGLYRDSWFYPAHGRFHLFNTCNTWTARMLIAAGVGVSLSGVKMADDLMSRLRDLPNVRQLTQGSSEKRALDLS